MRRILHCDMDSFYAAVHMRDDPSLRGRPVVIGGDPERRGVVAAASYEARDFGVRSAMPAASAHRLCPDAIFLRPDFPRYQEESEQIFEILRSFSPLVQPVSIDEAYLDVSDHLAGFGSATAVAQAIRERVRKERDLTVSIGVGPNRLVAKIASDFDKPDGLTVVPPGRVEEFLAPLSVRVLQGVGPATEQTLHDAFVVRTVAELRAVSERDLGARLGRYGATLYRYARGLDERPVVTHRERKSLSAERTYPRDIEEREVIKKEIERMAASVAAALERRQLVASTVVIKVRFSDFSTVTRSLTLEQPTSDAGVFRKTARRLLDRTEAHQRAVRLLGVGASRLRPVNEVSSQLSLGVS